VRSDISNPIRLDGSVEWLILDLLLQHSHRSWGVGELVDAIGSPIAVAEALETLQVAGLIQRTDAFVRIAPTSRKK
jgi:phosphatidylserine/phosphatidylglycerophosphate/cardiolipin synthase-like enzyme